MIGVYFVRKHCGRLFPPCLESIRSCCPNFITRHGSCTASQSNTCVVHRVHSDGTLHYNTDYYRASITSIVLDDDGVGSSFVPRRQPVRTVEVYRRIPGGAIACCSTVTGCLVVGQKVVRDLGKALSGADDRGPLHAPHDQFHVHTRELKASKHGICLELRKKPLFFTRLSVFCGGGVCD